MFDIDRFGRVNADHGSLVGDRILRHFAHVLRKSLAKTDLAARYGGQRFVAVFLDNGPQSGAKIMEFVRQTLERTTFRHNGEEIRLTACGAVTEAMPDEGYEALLDRLEATIHEAKQAGANRSCFHRGGKVEPVESPSLGAEYEEVVV